TFVNKDDVFQYYNDYVPTEEMIFKRNPSQIGRHVELCHPPRVLEKVKKVLTLLKTGKKDKVTMWFKSDKRELFVHITYAAVRNAAGEFEGVLEYVQEIQDFRAIDTDFNRDV
ncbi:PAS domain-containing protein, partial [Streptococcus pluranimalium]